MSVNCFSFYRPTGTSPLDHTGGPESPDLRAVAPATVENVRDNTTYDASILFVLRS